MVTAGEQAGCQAWAVKAAKRPRAWRWGTHGACITVPYPSLGSVSEEV
jgi:hypothetical protein